MTIQNNPVGEWEAEILRNRAERLSAGRELAQEVSLLWVGTFSVGPDLYAFELSALRAALPLRQVTPVPQADSRVLGIVRYQGEILTALSLSALLGTQGWRQDPVVLLVLNLPQGGRIAVDCEEVPRALALPEAEVSAAPRDPEKPWRRLRLPQEDRVLHLLNIDRLISLLEGGGRRGS